MFWICTGCGHDALLKITEIGNGIGNSWLDFGNFIVSRTMKMAKGGKLTLAP